MAMAAVAFLLMSSILHAEVFQLAMTLKVEIPQGTGRIISNPEGIDCSRSENFVVGDCQASFPVGEPLALMAIPISGESYTAQFSKWEGDCQGAIAVCSVNTSAHRTVKASFSAVGEPAFALPEPVSQEEYFYHPVVEPVKGPDPALCRPLAVGEYRDGLNLRVGLPSFTPGNVDIYIGISVQGEQNIFLIQPDLSLKPTNQGMTPWRADHPPMDIDEALYGTIPLSNLPSGKYDLFLWVKPHAQQSPYYLWRTYFAVL